MAKMQISPPIMKYLEDHKYEKVWLADLQALLGKDVRIASIQQAVLRLLNEKDWPIEIIQAGQCWIYKPGAADDSSVLVRERKATVKATVEAATVPLQKLVEENLHLAHFIMGTEAFIKRMAQMLIEAGAFDKFMNPED